MRFKLSLIADKNFFIPFNYNHIISSIIYNKIIDLELAETMHASKSFKFFTFSRINVPKLKIVNNGLICKDGKFSFIVSSCDEYLIKSMIQSYVDEHYVDFLGSQVKVGKIKMLPLEDFTDVESFKTISPVISTTKKVVNGKLKSWDLPPGDKFFNNLENNLIKKYLSFNSLEDTKKEIHISSKMRNVKSKRISVINNDNTVYNIAYLMDFILEGDSKLISFAYDVGLGEKSSMGFGMLDKIIRG